jgi:hypothetical protein
MHEFLILRCISSRNTDLEPAFNLLNHYLVYPNGEENLTRKPRCAWQRRMEL